MKIRYLSMFRSISIIIIIILVIPISFSYTSIYALDNCSLHNESLFYGDKTKFLIYYTQLIDEYNDMNSLYNFLVENGLDPPLSIHETLGAVKDIVESINIQVNSTGYDKLIAFSEVGLELLSSSNESLNIYMKSTYPIGKIYYYYRSIYNKLYNVSNALSDIYLGLYENGYLHEMDSYLSRLFNDFQEISRIKMYLYNYSIYTLEYKYRMFSRDINYYLKILGISEDEIVKKVNESSLLSWSSLIHYKYNKVYDAYASDQKIHDKLLDDYLKQIYSLLIIADKEVTMNGSLYFSYYLFSLVESNLYHIHDILNVFQNGSKINFKNFVKKNNSLIISDSRWTYIINLDKPQILVYEYDHVFFNLSLHRLLFYRDINKNNFPDYNEYILDYKLDSILWISRIESKRNISVSYTYMGSHMNISVQVSIYKNTILSPNSSLYSNDFIIRTPILIKEGDISVTTRISVANDSYSGFDESIDYTVQNTEKIERTVFFKPKYFVVSLKSSFNKLVSRYFIPSVIFLNQEHEISPLAYYIVNNGLRKNSFSLIFDLYSLSEEYSINFFVEPSSLDQLKYTLSIMDYIILILIIALVFLDILLFGYLFLKRKI